MVGARIWKKKFFFCLGFDFVQLVALVLLRGPGLNLAKVVEGGGVVLPRRGCGVARTEDEKIGLSAWF